MTRRQLRRLIRNKKRAFKPSDYKTARPHGCHLCDYRSKQRSLLVTHMKRLDWGIGTVMADSTSESVRVLFALGEERIFSLPLVALAKVNA